jgi:hypothetical protein
MFIWLENLYYKCQRYTASVDFLNDMVLITSGSFIISGNAHLINLNEADVYVDAKCRLVTKVHRFIGGSTINQKKNP